MPDAVEVRDATPDERPAVRNVIDGAALQTGVDSLPESIVAGDVLVAVAGDRILGVLVLDECEITAVAVRTRRRGNGIGTALVDTAKRRQDRLTASCDPSVRPFWAACEFEMRSCTESDRLRGVWER